VRLESRPANVEERGEVTVRDLLPAQAGQHGLCARCLCRAGGDERAAGQDACRRRA
jgi:hypothetical protein